METVENITAGSNKCLHHLQIFVLEITTIIYLSVCTQLCTKQFNFSSLSGEIPRLNECQCGEEREEIVSTLL